MINKDTKIYGSFSNNPGNNGCKFFNSKFKEDNINAIYKSFYSSNIRDSINAVKILGIKGCAISMPFKVKVLKYVDIITPEATAIGAANTIINHNNILTAYNTDWLGVYKFLSSASYLENNITILGNGGFSKAVQYACNRLNITFNIIKRNNWGLVPTLKGIIFNCTPVEVTTQGYLIDGRPNTDTGLTLANLQALEQYKIYTNVS